MTVKNLFQMLPNIPQDDKTKVKPKKKIQKKERGERRNVSNLPVRDKMPVMSPVLMTRPI